MKEFLLAPIPKRIRRLAGRLRLNLPLRIGWPEMPARERRCLHGRLILALDLRRLAGTRPISDPAAVKNTFAAFRLQPGFHPQGYHLRIKPRGIVVEASTPQGLFHALSTLGQLAIARPGSLPCLDIRDQPDIPVRGVMLDVSRDKVPKMSTLLRLVDWLSWLKTNQLQLYTEHTFAYRRHRTVWKDASPFTPTEIRRLDRFCRDRYIELVPNQNCFGHMERWLKHARYRPLAETSKPWRDPWGRVRTTPSTLCPGDPRSLKLVTGLLDELVPNFTSRQVNVGCDETFELGQGRSKTACRRRGVGRVYLDYLLKLYEHVSSGGRRMQFWADIVHQHPELIRRLPRDVIPLEWGYEADHPFDKRCKALRRAGLDFYVCPGTSSWCSFAGRTDNALANLASAAVAGKRHGATGYLITDWGDGGHRQQLPVSYIPFLYGAAVSWNAASRRRLDVVRAASVLAFGDSSGRAGKVWYDIGNVYKQLKVLVKNQSVLFQVVQADLKQLIEQSSPSPDPLRGMTIHTMLDLFASLSELRLRHLDAYARNPELFSSMDTCGTWPLSMRDGFLYREFIQTAEVLGNAVKRIQLVMQEKEGSFCDWEFLAKDTRLQLVAHRATWLRRNRPGGLRDSLAHFQRNLDEYRAMARLAKARAVRDDASPGGGPRARRGTRNKARPVIRDH